MICDHKWSIYSGSVYCERCRHFAGPTEVLYALTTARATVAVLESEVIALRARADLFQRALQYALSLPDAPTVEACAAWVADHEARKAQEG